MCSRSVTGSISAFRKERKWNPSQVPEVSAQPVGGTANASGSRAINSDFDTFLKMLTAQMRNQDPLNPVESADFAVQLATFSSVEQQVQTNELLSDLGAQMTTLGMGQLSGWIGLEAEARAPARFTGDPVSLRATVDPSAESAELVVTDAQGVVVQRAEIPAQSGPVAWTGRDNSACRFRWHLRDFGAFNRGGRDHCAP